MNRVRGLLSAALIFFGTLAFANPDCSSKLQVILPFGKTEVAFWRSQSHLSQHLFEEFNGLAHWLAEAPPHGLDFLAVTQALAPPILRADDLERLSSLPEIQDLEVVLTTELKDLQGPMQGILYAYHWSEGAQHEWLERLFQSPTQFVLLAKLLSGIAIETSLRSGPLPNEMSAHGFFTLTRRIEHWLPRTSSLHMILMASSALREAYVVNFVNSHLLTLWEPQRANEFLRNVPASLVTHASRWRVRVDTTNANIDFMEFDRWSTPVTEWFLDNINYLYSHGSVATTVHLAPVPWRKNFFELLDQIFAPFPKKSTPPISDNYIQMAQALNQMVEVLQEDSGPADLKTLLIRGFLSGQLKGAPGGLIAGAALSLIQGIKVSKGSELSSQIQGNLRRLAADVMTSHFPVTKGFEPEQADPLTAVLSHRASDRLVTDTAPIPDEALDEVVPVYGDERSTNDDLTVFVQQNSIAQLKPNVPYSVHFLRQDPRHAKVQKVIFTQRALDDMNAAIKYKVHPIRWLMAIRMGMAATSRQGGINFLFHNDNYNVKVKLFSSPWRLYGNHAKGGPWIFDRVANEH